jgi:hypothetical protein
MLHMSCEKITKSLRQLKTPLKQSLLGLKLPAMRGRGVYRCGGAMGTELATAPQHHSTHYCNIIQQLIRPRPWEFSGFTYRTTIPHNGRSYSYCIRSIGIKNPARGNKYNMSSQFKKSLKGILT